MPTITIVSRWCPACSRYHEIQKVNSCIRCASVACLRRGFRSRKYGAFCPKCFASLAPGQQEILRAETKKYLAIYRTGMSFFIAAFLAVFAMYAFHEPAFTGGQVFNIRMALLAAFVFLLVAGGVLISHSRNIDNDRAVPLPVF